MKILHITPHLGGGIGKAHAVINKVLPKSIDQTFLLLEAPIEKRYAQRIKENGSSILVADDLVHVARLAKQADIVQFEFINHPRMFECLARSDFPKMRSVIWSHISGLFRPFIAPRLMEIPSRFVFSSRISLKLNDTCEVINSGFGFEDSLRISHKIPVIAYLGTVDFVKMHSGFFEAIENLENDLTVFIFGECNPSVREMAAKTRHPDRFKFCGKTVHPEIALSMADIFFYPLQSKHYGTGENALVEAMSLGLVPVVLDNPAEMEIVRDSETGFVAHSISECTELLKMILSAPNMREKISGNASDFVKATRTPEQSAREFINLWKQVMDEPAEYCDFRMAIGNTPLDWFLSTQGKELVDTSQEASKGRLAHFAKVFAGDESFTRL